MAYGLTQSLDFEFGSAQTAEAADSDSLSITGAITLEGWVNIESLPADGDRRGFAWKWTGTNQRTYEFSLRNTAGTYYLHWTATSDGAGTVEDNLEVTWTPSLDTWYHVAVTYLPGATSRAKFYVDGVQQGTDKTGVVTSMSNTTAVFHLSQNSGGIYMDGEMSLWRVWNVVRTVTEINDNKCNVYGTATTNMAAEWSLNNVLTDASGNANTLTAINAPLFVANIPSTCSVSIGAPISNLALLGVG